MSQLQHRDANGQLWILRGGSWRQATEAEIADQTAPEAAISAAGRTLQGMQGIGQMALGALLHGNSPGVPGPAPGSFRRQLIDTGLENLRESGADLAERQVLQPGATFAGEVMGAVLDPLNVVGAGVFSQGARAAARRTAVEVAEDNAARQVMDLPAAAPQAARSVSPDQARQMGSLVTDFAPGTAGAAERAGFWQAMKNVPGLRTALEGLEEFVGAQRPLTADQSRILSSGRADELGFEWLPGQREGNNIIPEIIKSQPFMADALDPVLTANARNLENRVARALGVPGEDLGRGILSAADETFEAGFQNIARRLGSQEIPEDLFQEISETALTRRSRQAFGELAEETERRFTGDQILEMRSRMNSQLAALRRNNEQLAADNMTEAIEELDEIIQGALGQARAREFYDLRQRWRVSIAMDSPGVIQPDGSVSLRSLNNALLRTFKTEYRRNLWAPTDTGLPGDVRDLMDYVRIASAFESNLGDSGTATRTALGQMINNPKQYASQRIAAKWIQDVLLNRPHQAAELPGP